MFKRASPDGYVSLRAFPDTGSRAQKHLFIYPIALGDKDFVDMVFEHARRAAEWHVSAVFCPPVATFRTHKNAKTDNLCEGVCLSVECDQRPLEARQTLEALRRFFERRPDGNHRVRLACQAEISQHKIIDSRPMTIPPGWRIFTVIRNIAPGFRLCLFIPNLEDAEPDLDEAAAREVFEWVAEPYREVESQMCRAAGLRS